MYMSYVMVHCRANDYLKDKNILLCGMENKDNFTF